MSDTELIKELKAISRFWGLSNSVKRQVYSQDSIGLLQDCVTIDNAITMLEQKESDIKAKQAKIDALMFEYCPDEMTKEQVEEYAKHQQPIGEKESD